MRRERVKKGTDRQTTGKEGKRPRNPIGDMEREGEKACDLGFFYKTSALHNEKSEVREEREKKIVYFSCQEKGVTSVPYDRGIIKVISKSEVCRALFDAEKVFQIFRMYI